MDEEEGETQITMFASNEEGFDCSLNEIQCSKYNVLQWHTHLLTPLTFN